MNIFDIKKVLVPILQFSKNFNYTDYLEKHRCRSSDLVFCKPVSVTIIRFYYFSGTPKTPPKY